MANFKLRTRAMNAAEAAKLWQRQYANWTLDDEKRQIGERLSLLGETPNPDDVDRIIGNVSWTQMICPVCQNFCESIVETQHADDEQGEIRLCAGCVKEAAACLQVC